MRVISVLAGALATMVISTGGLAAADLQPAGGPGATTTGAQAQMGPASRSATGGGGTAPLTPEELQRREDQLNRVNRSPGRPTQPDAPVSAPASDTQSPRPAPPHIAADCQIYVSFARFVELLPVSGECLEQPHVDLDSGDILQVTTAGLFVERAMDGSVAFTDGQRTWMLTSGGAEAIVFDTN